MGTRDLRESIFEKSEVALISSGLDIMIDRMTITDKGVEESRLDRI
jgi:hypothetical protein